MSQKHDAGKPRFDLLPPRALLEVVQVLTQGAEKYGAYNWQTVDDAQSRYISACLRHISAWQLGDKVDEETSYHHLAHAVCSLLFILHNELINQNELPSTSSSGAQGAIPPPSSHLET